MWRVAILASVAIHLVAFLLWRSGVQGPPGAMPPGRSPLRTFASEPIEGVKIAPAARREVRVASPVLSLEMPSVQMERFAATLATPTFIPEVPLGGPPALTIPPTPEVASVEEGYSPPVPRSILPNWRPPPSIEGTDVVVRVFVDAGGRVGKWVELHPPTSDRAFNRRLARRVLNLDYRPALRGGRPVSGWAEIRFVFCPGTVTATSPPGSARDRPPRCSRRPRSE